jgi:hypothetical protein
MATHGHRHPADHAHPPASVHPSILRLSALQRLGIAVAMIVVVWATALWAMR